MNNNFIGSHNNGRIRLYPLFRPLHSTATAYSHDLLFICKLLSSMWVQYHIASSLCYSCVCSFRPSNVCISLDTKFLFLNSLLNVHVILLLWYWRCCIALFVSPPPPFFSLASCCLDDMLSLLGLLGNCSLIYSCVTLTILYLSWLSIFFSILLYITLYYCLSFVI